MMKKRLHQEYYKFNIQKKNLPINEHLFAELGEVALIVLKKTAYNHNIRNAIAHSDYHCIQRGIYYDNFGSDKYADLQAIGFEDWEQKYCMSYFLFIGIFQVLKQIKDEFYYPLSKNLKGKGIPVRIPDKADMWIEKYIYPNQNGETWRFTRA